ncbi:MAG: hypothetical protein HeimC3_07230 [Candidatus Heimdallarchaeota archaeon LC_3]|nr:MAG: hypothetical protein HeimC3_07230 [Candidatus Heimdallarchaeota archaeon LC_3]
MNPRKWFTKTKIKKFSFLVIFVVIIFGLTINYSKIILGGNFNTSDRIILESYRLQQISMKKLR